MAGAAGRPDAGEGTAGPGAAVTRNANWHTRLADAGQSLCGLSCGDGCATSPGPGAAPRTSAASVTSAWLIRVLRWIQCPPAPRIDQVARINRGNRRTPSPG